MPSPDREKSRSSANKGVPPKDPADPRPSTPRGEVVDIIRRRRVCYYFAFGIACDPGGTSMCTTTFMWVVTGTSNASVGRQECPRMKPLR